MIRDLFRYFRRMKDRRIDRRRFKHFTERFGVKGEYVVEVDVDTKDRNQSSMRVLHVNDDGTIHVLIDAGPEGDGPDL